MGSINVLRIIYLIVGGSFAGIVMYLLAKKKINERNTLLWLAGALSILIISAFPSLLNWTARKIGVDYPPALLFLFSALILLVIVLHQSIQISVLNEKVKQLAQHVALQKVDGEQEGQ
ncbi:DUF2304 domain-containing protein [Paenibacillus aceris]|uniref:DUF2304 domain-containing protein n=1 Tax=Paenibacillus aceris TaxID=869555 RepID=A0ABS4HT37_9BACL|nr:DUF2304 domain-containing protein [Paenibacillus aceris]MBP1961787.1 hypothetical protein [Paenibacillus aceris]NHW34356.1 DUF2304 domain-containing protein [Paenibacillus aceris]